MSPTVLIVLDRHKKGFVETIHIYGRNITLEDLTGTEGFRISRNQEICFAIIMLASVIIGFLLLPPALNPEQEPDPEQVEFQGEWVVSVNETYQFDVESGGGYNGGNYNVSEWIKMLSLDGTVINVTITFLPSLDLEINKTTFETEIVEVQKVSCIFGNGTELPSTWLHVISMSISGCILPVGDWSILNAYHPTFDQHWYEPYWGNTYFSELFDNSFQFGYAWSPDEDDGEQWNGTISLDRGFPTIVSWSYDHMYGPIELELTLRS
ncbi:MAG: hypothetical protein ACFFE2_17155 [Candidatus Thorarchaeota archaeon]